MLHSRAERGGDRPDIGRRRGGEGGGGTPSKLLMRGTAASRGQEVGLGQRRGEKGKGAGKGSGGERNLGTPRTKKDVDKTDVGEMDAQVDAFVELDATPPPQVSLDSRSDLSDLKLIRIRFEFESIRFEFESIRFEFCLTSCSNILVCLLTPTLLHNILPQFFHPRPGPSPPDPSHPTPNRDHL